MRLLLGLLLLSACSNAPSAPANVDMARPVVGPQPACLPAGYAVVPFVTDAPVRSFSDTTPTLQDGKDYVAVLETDAGCLALDLYEQTTPITVNSFVFLALHHYFDGIAFHRVINGFMAQTGDPNTFDQDPSTWG